MLTQRSGRLLVTLTVVSLSFVMSGCTPTPGEFPPSGSQDPPVIAARERAAAEQDKLLAAAAMGEALSMGVRDGCESGTNSEPWGPRDYFYWRCNRTTSWVVRSDLGDPGEIIAAYRAHLAAIGCEPDPASFDMAAQYWALYGPTRQNANGEPYTVDDLPGAGANCTEDMQIGIGFRSSVGFDVAQYEHSYTSDGEEIEARNLDQTVIRSSGTEYIVTLSASTSYHQVLRSDPQPSDESTPEPLPCACYSGSSCDCPGG